MERAKGSALWRYFMLAMPASSTATCNICKASVPRGAGDDTANYNTANLIPTSRSIMLKSS